jgi:hypothetical protein
LNWFVDACPLCVIFRVILDAVINEDRDVVFEQHRQRVYSRQLLHSQLTKTIAQVVPGVCETPNQAFNKLAAALRLPSAILCQSFRPKPRIDNRKQMAGPVCLSPFAYPPLAYPNRGPIRTVGRRVSVLQVNTDS